MDPSPFAAVFTPGARFARQQGAPVVLSTRTIADLHLPSGRLFAGDAYFHDYTAPVIPLARAAPIGVFPVELALADEGHHTFVACARVRFAAGPAARWEPALYADQAPGDDPAHGNDSRIGCFRDAAARATVDDATVATWVAAMDRNRVPTWTWHAARLGPANLVMFSAGHGEGSYTSYWGLDARDRLVELVTDFRVLWEWHSERLVLPLPLPGGVLAHPWLNEHGVMVSRSFLAPNTAFIQGPRGMSVHVIHPTERLVPLERWEGSSCRVEWKRSPPGLQLVISLDRGMRPLVPL